MLASVKVMTTLFSHTMSSSHQREFSRAMWVRFEETMSQQKNQKPLFFPLKSQTVNATIIFPVKIPIIKHRDGLSRGHRFSVMTSFPSLKRPADLTRGEYRNNMSLQKAESEFCQQEIFPLNFSVLINYWVIWHMGLFFCAEKRPNELWITRFVSFGNKCTYMQSYN